MSIIIGVILLIAALCILPDAAVQLIIGSVLLIMALSFLL